MIGTNLGRYELMRPLAAGGMGELYLARQDASVPGFSTLVAIKVLLPNLSANKAFVTMFLEEARTIAKLRHPHIVQIRDIAQQAGQYYMVMEYISGQNLRELLGNATISDRPLFSPRLGAQLFADLASALAAVHREGLVHRDVSPTNIMISDQGVPKLIDFGVARALGTASLTNPGTLKGKFGYMAPEYIRSHAYDQRVDLFSLGVVMWETFARRRLFHGTNAAEQLHRVLDSDVPRLDDLVPGVPSALADLVESTLQRDPARRIATAVDLADRLGELGNALAVDHDAPTLRRWLEQRVSGQIDARRELERLLLAVPGGGLDAWPQGTAPGQRPAPPPVEPHRPGHSGTSTRLASGEVLEIVPTSAPQPRPPQRRSVVLIAVAALAVGVLAAVALTRQAPPTAAATAPRPPAPPAAADSRPVVAVHRAAGLQALADHDYAKAISEFAEGMRGGADGDLLRLLELARRLQREAADRPVRSMHSLGPQGTAQTK